MADPEIAVPPVVHAQAQDVCASDPNFAVIFAFCERFGDNCGVVIPTFQELQEMLEKTDEVPDALVDLHIKLLRRVKKSVHVDKWEKAILKFCQAYSIPDFWELEHYGYKGISVQLKLRILKTLFEAQFDSNVKFKAEINKLESSILRSQPLGWDKSGIAYWVQFDRACNLRVYKEDTDEDKWNIVASDRNTLVNLINDLSGTKDNTLGNIEDENSIGTNSDAEVELSEGLDEEKHSPASPNTTPIIENNKRKHSTNESTIECKKKNIDSEEMSINIKEENDDKEELTNKIDSPIVGEVIEESVMIVKGEGTGQECDTGNPEETNTKNENSKNEDLKKPILWSIETICSSSKEVQEENISVPTTGFFFGDDSVPCLNVSNGEKSCFDDKKLEVGSSEVKKEELKKIEKLNEVDSTSQSSTKDEEECFNKNNKQSVFNIKVDEKEIQITERNANDVFTKPKSSIKNDTNKTDVVEPISDDTCSEPQEPQLSGTTHISKTIKNNQCDVTDKYGTYQSKIIDEHEISSINKEVENDSFDQQPLNNSDSFYVDIDKQTLEQKKLSVRSEENKDDETGQQLKKDDQLAIKIDDQTIKINTNILEIKQSTSMNDQCNEVKRVGNYCEKVKVNEPVTNTINQCSTKNDHQNVDIKQNVCTLGKTTSNLVDFDVSTNNQVLTNVSNIIDKKKAIVNSVLESKKTDEQESEDFSEHTLTNDNSEINASCTESDNTTVNEIDGNSNNKVHDQIITEDVNQCLNTSKQIDQNKKNPKKTSHNIRNIIETDVVVNNDSVNSNNIDENKDVIQQKNYQIKNKSSRLYNDIQEENKLNMNVDNQIVSNNKYNLDKILQKSNKKKSEKETTKKFNLKDKPESSNVESKIGKINKDKSEINIKELKTKSMDISNDLIVENKDCKLIVNKKEIDLVTPNVQTQKKNINMVDKMPKYTNDNEVTKISTKQYSIDSIKQENMKVNCTEIKPITLNKNKKGKHKLMNTESKTKVCFEEKLSLGKSENILGDTQNKHESRSIIEAPVKKDDDKNTTNKLTKNNRKLEHERKVTTDTDIKNQKSKLKEIESEQIHDLKNNDTLNISEEQNIISPVNDDICDSAVETNEDTLIENLKEEINNSKLDHTIEEDIKQSEEEEIEGTKKKRGRPGRKKAEEEVNNRELDHTIEEDIKQSEEEEIEGTQKKRGRPGRKKAEEEVNNSELDHTIEEDIKQSEEEEEIEGTQKKRGRPGRKKGKKGKVKKNTTIKQEINTEERVKRPYKPRQKKVVTIVEEVTVIPEPSGDENIRRSRRIAEIKIKEQFIPSAHYDDIDIPLKGSKKKDKGGKKGSTPSKKIITAEESDDEDEEDPISKKFKKRKKKGKPDSVKKLNTKNPWNVDSESSSSENNIGLFEDYDHEEEDEIPRPGIEPNVSDHEFSPESDINEDEEYLPEKRARTAHKKDQNEPLKDDMSCKMCNKNDQPEWILLCDTCNHGWHASCLHPALMVIPDGDWYCPPCRHKSLLDALKDILKKYDGESKKRENEELRRKRLAYVGISLQNVISSKTEDEKIQKRPVVYESSEDDEDESESESYDSEPLYQLRARRKTNVSYRFNDYDDMINEAILETGVDESVVTKSAEVKTDKNDNDEKTDSDADENVRNREDSPIAPALLHLRGRKKSKKLTNLDVSSDDGSDEDFKGPSDGDDDYEEDMSEYSDDSVKRSEPTRRSVRNRKNVVDPDFINDDSSEDSNQRSKKKRSRPWSDSSNSEEEDFAWGKKKKKRTNTPSSSSKGLKRKRNENNRKPQKSKIKYGMDSDSDSDDQPKRRTRGRQITYAESDDSEVEVQTKKRKVASDDEDEYVVNDEELEAENEDHNLEVDDEEEDQVVSNEEKDDEAVDDEEEEEEDVNPKPKTTSVPQLTVTSPSTTVSQSVIKKPTTTTLVSSVPPASSVSPVSSVPPVSSVSPVIDSMQDDNLHQRVLPSVTKDAVQANDKSPSQLSAGTPNKVKRLPHQLKKSLSPSPSVDSGGSYLYRPDATKVVSTVPSPIHVTYNKPSGAATEGFKLITATVPSSLAPGGFSATPAHYRGNNKTTTPPVVVPAPSEYLPPQVQVQPVYQTPLSANYSPYPIDYVAPGAPLQPPPPAIAFRNIVATPSISHETPMPPPVHQQPSTGSVAGTGDSEFGGLVSYFSSQQEDDFDT